MNPWERCVAAWDWMVERRWWVLGVVYGGILLLAVATYLWGRA